MSSIPTKYTRAAAFAAFEVAAPNTPKSGTDLDMEFERLRATTDQTIDRLSEIQRDDGKLRNESVHPGSLSPEVLALIGNIVPRGVWATKTEYAIRDVVACNDATYIAAEAHTAGADFVTDFEAGRWLYLGGGAGLDTYVMSVSAGETEVDFSGTIAAGVVGQVFYNGIYQQPNAYIEAGYVLTFDEPFPADGEIAVSVTTVPYNSVSTANMSYLAAGSGTQSRSVKSRLDDVVSVASFPTPANAVAHATLIGGELYWPAGDWTAAASVPGLWEVEHCGPGRLLRGAATLPFSPGESDEIALYVDPTGNDANDGLTTTAPLLTIQRAVDIFVAHGSRGRWTINLAAGTYTENVSVSSLTPMEFPLDVRGPSVGGHPNVPAAVIEAAVTANDVFALSDSAWCRLYDVQLSGATTGAGVNVQRGRCTLANVHIEGCLGGVVNQHGATLGAVGGIWSGLGKATVGGIGYASFYNATHSLVAASQAAALVIEDYEKGLLINEGAQGHLDYTVVQDCATGIQWQRGAGACNTDSMTIKRCDVGIEARNQWFNNGITFGTGADANTVNVRCAGDAPEFDFRTSDYSSRTRRLQQTTYDVSHTGTVAATQVWTFTDLRPWMISEGGDLCEIVAVLSNAATLGTVGVSVFLWDGTTEDFLSGVALPIGTTNAQIRALIHFSGAAVQRSSVAAIHNAGALCGAYGTGALNLKDKTGALRIKITLSNAADTVTFCFIELNTTLGG